MKKGGVGGAEGGRAPEEKFEESTPWSSSPPEKSEKAKRRGDAGETLRCDVGQGKGLSKRSQKKRGKKKFFITVLPHPGDASLIN